MTYIPPRTDFDNQSITIRGMTKEEIEWVKRQKFNMSVTIRTLIQKQIEYEEIARDLQKL